MKKLIVKKQTGGSFNKRPLNILNYFRDNVVPYLEYYTTRNRTGESYPNYTWTGKPIREFDDSRNAPIYNPYMSTVVPVKNEKGQNGFLEYMPYFFDESLDTNNPNYSGKYTEKFYPEDDSEFYKKLKNTYNEVTKNGWNSKEYFHNNENNPNPFFNYRKEGGRIKLVARHLYGKPILNNRKRELEFSRQYFVLPENLTDSQLKFVDTYSDKRYNDPWGVSNEDAYNFYKGWEENFGPYEQSTLSTLGYYMDDSGKVNAALYRDNQWLNYKTREPLDIKKYKVYTSPLNYSKENGYYYKIGDNIYKGGLYR